MNLQTIAGHTVLEYKHYWFIWEPAWECFRPIDSFAWNGTQYWIDDRAYCSDPLSPLYGYGTPQMKQLCDALSEAVGPRIGMAMPRPSPCIGDSEWFFDRMISLTPCAPRDHASWKAMSRGRHRTLRKGSRNKLTRRTL